MYSKINSTQCRDIKTGVLCAFFSVLVRTSAVAFCSICDRWVFFSFCFENTSEESIAALSLSGCSLISGWQRHLLISLPGQTSHSTDSTDDKKKPFKARISTHNYAKISSVFVFMASLTQETHFFCDPLTQCLGLLFYLGSAGENSARILPLILLRCSLSISSRIYLHRYTVIIAYNWHKMTFNTMLSDEGEACTKRRQVGPKCNLLELKHFWCSVYSPKATKKWLERLEKNKNFLVIAENIFVLFKRGVFKMTD